MGFLSKSKPSRPERVPTDTVVPLSFADDQPHARAICLHHTCRFDDVLDIEALRLSLERLLELDGWRRLGARLRLNDNGKLEYHIPAEYSPKRPATDFTVSKYSMGISDHALGAKFPRASSQPTVVGCPMDLVPLCIGPQSPRQIEDWLYSDRPQFAIHVVLFDDATLVTVTWMHTLTDAMGLAGFFKAWTAVLNGREEDVPEFQGIGETPLQQLGQHIAGETYVNYKFMLKGFGLLSFAFWYFFELFWYRREEQRIMCIPGRFVEQMRTESLKELRHQNKEENAPFVSESDVLFAWWTRAQTRALNPFRSRTITLMNVFDIRAAALPESASQNSALVANAVQTSLTFLRPQQILNQPLGFLASQIRHSLVQVRTKPQVEAFYALYKSELTKTGHSPLYAAPNGLLLGCTNWHRARFFEVDFSAAVVKKGRGSDCTNNRGRPSYLNTVSLTTGLSLRNLAQIVGKDASGNWWLMCALRKEAWPTIEEELKSLGAKDSR
ncbi:hypothetical protein F9C07_2287016 [Aspergillus flavus]|uniref:LysR family regulatory protein n=1 Tax=Aspergillus flavus (strain ATCC 200026 / FGSC A1120 / IAM 13836 / NRRL 3357 / JCM 12722 / SRRC 167) TaxID=332952 RepID=A0A7G5KLB7_ASPFN|nr:uncharacterized protein G4B84_012133 [Aspergillus flavus NRRL3357]KAF7626330.1 hypothetical protein AFLA_013723 [Aspergillus flavus NRRL3357]QMW36604.1 hypothetical protein G4B84_012133 [Aspergillus flavus NRRL3357]QMW48659.1 hypothetical protein G4B11_012177 [Aspergillus flavus]QRD92347.1 hypothetical protein F9C07_2287016 [Aspergillus flavus]